MEENEDEPEDVRKATPVEEEIKKGETDEHSARPTNQFEASTRKRHRCEKNVSKKKLARSEGECCRAKLAKAARAPKTATVLVYEKECTLPRIKVVPRHCLSKDEWIDILATPSRKCPSPCLQKPVTRKIRPVSARMAELAQPPKQRLLNTLQDRGGNLPTELVDNLIQTLEGETCLTPEQAEKIFRDKETRAKKKCRKKNKSKCKGDKVEKLHTESGVASNISSLDKDAVHCQYLMAESFVKSILEWKCPIPRDEFKDIADVILKRLGYILEYSPSNGEDRKSQQMKFLADIIASWISGVLFEVAEARKAELEEECERRRKEKDEESEEESEDESEEEIDDDDEDDDDDDDKKKPPGRGGPPRRGKDDKQKKKGGKDRKDDDDDKKPGKRGKEKDPKEKLEAGGVKDPDTQPQDKERASRAEEIFHDARTEPGTPPHGDEKKTSVTKSEDTAKDKISKDLSLVQRYSKLEDPSVKVAAVSSIADGEIDEHVPFEDSREKALVAEQSPDSVKGESEIGKREDDSTAKKPAVVLQGEALGFSEIGEERKTDDEDVANDSPRLPGVEEINERKAMEIGDKAGPIKISERPEESSRVETAKITTTVVGEANKEVVAGDSTDERAAGDKIDDRELAAKPRTMPEDLVISEPRKEEEEDTGLSITAVDSAGDAASQLQQVLKAAEPIQDSSIPIIGEDEEFKTDEEVKKKVETFKETLKPVSADESFDKGIKLKEDGQLQSVKPTVEPSQDPSAVVITEKLKSSEIELMKEDRTKTNLELFKDNSKFAMSEERKQDKKTTSADDDERKKVAEASDDPSKLVTVESLKDKRRQSEKKRFSKKPSSIITTLAGKKYETDAPFVTFDKIFHTIYNAIEASNENPGGDSITNRIHRAVYEKCANVVQEESPGPLSPLTKDVLDVMSGKIALWLRNVLTESQLSFMNKLPATVESVDVREWSQWIGYVSDTANTWSTWIQRTIRQAEGMRSKKVTRGDWRDWTKSVETDALRWRRFYLESLHQAHHNVTIIRDRHVVKTGTRRVADHQKEEYEEEMKITDLEVER